MHYSRKYRSGWWVNIYKTSYIVNVETNENLELLNVIKIRNAIACISKKILTYFFYIF
jgi:hypothetical protein